MAGPGERAWKITDHPDQAWVRATWADRRGSPSGRSPMTDNVRLTVAQALVRFLGAQYSERDGVGRSCSPAASASSATATWRVSGRHCSRPNRRTGPAALHPGPQRAGDGAHRGRRTPGRRTGCRRTRSRPASARATNMLTGAALATINRLPVLLLPGRHLRRPRGSPVLQELEAARAPATSRSTTASGRCPVLRPGLAAGAAARRPCSPRCGC